MPNVSTRPSHCLGEVCICELRKWLIWLSELAISFSGYWTRMGSRLSRLKAASCSGVVLA